MNAPEPARGDEAVGAVLLVEADDPTRAAAAEMLRACGHGVLEASSTEAALNTLRQHEVALLMVDVALPGESGLVFAARARQMHPHLPIVLTTACDLPDDSPGGNGPLVLRKPYGVGALRAVLREVALR